MPLMTPPMIYSTRKVATPPTVRYLISSRHPSRSADRKMLDILVYALSKFISIPSVSSLADHREDCRQAAIWLTKCFAQLGASSKTVCAHSPSLHPLEIQSIETALRGPSSGTQPDRLCVLPGRANTPSETSHPLLRVRRTDRQMNG